MAPKLNSDAAKRNGSNGKAAAPNSTTQNPYAPSVPIPVYRELAAELQATKAMLESLNAQNQALVRQNALLRKEVQTIVQSAFQLQSLMAPIPAAQPADVVPPMMDAAAIAPPPATPTIPVAEPARPTPAPTRAPSKGAPESSAPAPTPANLKFTDLPPVGSTEAFFTAQPESPRITSEKTPRQLNGLWLLLVVLAIMVTAFTAGFLVMRPLLLKSSQ